MGFDLLKNRSPVKSGLRRFQDANKMIMHTEKPLAAIRLSKEAYTQPSTKAFLLKEL
jgi:hypothetical protein